MPGVDILIQNALLVDGTGEPLYVGAISICGDKIAEIGTTTPQKSKFTIDAKGKVVTPGFIDAHTHSDLTLLFAPTADSFIRQGVTTQVIGNCGFSLAPIGGANETEFPKRGFLTGLEDIPWHWHSLPEYRALLGECQPATNVATLVGHNTLRTYVLGWGKTRPSEAQLKQICALTEKTIEQGAIGISVGLEYPPGSYADLPELVELARTVSRHDGIFAIHLRNEADQLLRAVEEAITIAKRSGCRGEVNHLKAAGSQNWGKVKQAVELLEAAREDGVDIAYDCYPFESWVSGLTSLVPPQFLESGIEGFISKLGDPVQRRQMKSALAACEELSATGVDVRRESERVLIAWVRSPERKCLVGKSLKEIAEDLGLSPLETFLRLLEHEEGQVGGIVFGMCEEDVEFVIKSLNCAIISDGASVDPENPRVARVLHPRFFSSFARILDEYVRKRGVLSLPEAVHKMTQMPAERYRIKGRGLLKEGYFADLVIFDPEKVHICSTYSNPAQFPEGIEWVLVNGQIALGESQLRIQRAGRVL